MEFFWKEFQVLASSFNMEKTHPHLIKALDARVINANSLRQIVNQEERVKVENDVGV